MNRILLPVDLSQNDATTKVLEQAKKLGAVYDVGFVLLHVLDPIPHFVEAEIPKDVFEGHEKATLAKLRELAELFGIGGRSEIVVRRGRAQHEIVDVAEKTGAEIIVIASHQPRASDILLGSVAASVVRHARCSVMVLR